MKYTLKEWRAEAENRFGSNTEAWRFVCPACGRINTGREFRELDAEPNDMYQTCIGRHNGKGAEGAKHKPGTPPPEFGCNWAAFGLLGTLGKGDVVVTDEGKEVEVFSLAEKEAVAQ